MLVSGSVRVLWVSRQKHEKNQIPFLSFWDLPKTDPGPGRVSKAAEGKTRLLANRGFPKIRGTFLGIPIIRTVVYWGLY